MNGRLGKLLRDHRGTESRLSFVKKLRLSYTFVRSIEEGLRLPSDQIVAQIAECLDLDTEELLIAAYCDRSEPLARALAKHGVPGAALTVAAASEPEPPLPGNSVMPEAADNLSVQAGETTA